MSYQQSGSLISEVSSVTNPVTEPKGSTARRAALIPGPTALRAEVLVLSRKGAPPGSALEKPSRRQGQRTEGRDRGQGQRTEGGEQGS